MDLIRGCQHDLDGPTMNRCRKPRHGETFRVRVITAATLATANFVTWENARANRKITASQRTLSTRSLRAGVGSTTGPSDVTEQTLPNAGAQTGVAWLVFLHLHRRRLPCRPATDLRIPTAGLFGWTYYIAVRLESLFDHFRDTRTRRPAMLRCSAWWALPLQRPGIIACRAPWGWML